MRFQNGPTDVVRKMWCLRPAFLRGPFHSTSTSTSNSNSALAYRGVALIPLDPADVCHVAFSIVVVDDARIRLNPGRPVAFLVANLAMGEASVDAVVDAVGTRYSKRLDSTAVMEGRGTKPSMMTTLTSFRNAFSVNRVGLVASVAQCA